MGITSSKIIKYNVKDGSAAHFFFLKGAEMQTAHKPKVNPKWIRKKTPQTGLIFQK